MFWQGSLLSIITYFHPKFSKNLKQKILNAWNIGGYTPELNITFSSLSISPSPSICGENSPLKR